MRRYTSEPICRCIGAYLVGFPGIWGRFSLARPAPPIFWAVSPLRWAQHCSDCYYFLGLHLGTARSDSKSRQETWIAIASFWLYIRIMIYLWLFLVDLRSFRQSLEASRPGCSRWPRCQWRMSNLDHRVLFRVLCRILCRCVRSERYLRFLQ